MPNPAALDLFADPALTRRIAREEVLGVSARHRAELLAALRQYGPMTADEAGDRVGLGPLQARPRMTELSKEGAIVATGTIRPSALGNPSAVWRVA